MSLRSQSDHDIPLPPLRAAKSDELRGHADKPKLARNKQTRRRSFQRGRPLVQLPPSFGRTMYNSLPPLSLGPVKSARVHLLPCTQTLAVSNSYTRVPCLGYRRPSFVSRLRRFVSRHVVTAGSEQKPAALTVTQNTKQQPRVRASQPLITN